jgi:DNA-binding SARP family transcriptional activator/predicted Zn-dependent protease
MPSARLTLLGGFRMTDADGSEVRIASRKAQALLAILGLACPEPVPRERVVGLLWGDQSDERARHSLRQALTTLRRSAPPVFTAHGDTLSLDCSACAVDAVEFRVLAAAGDTAGLDRAAALYRGPLLDGLDGNGEGLDDWLNVEREHLEGLAADVMARLADRLIESRNHESAVAALQRWLAVDPACEDAHRRLIGVLDALGRRSAARQQYETCRAALRRHLGVEPTPETRRLADALFRRDPADDAAPSTAPSRGAAHPAVAVLPFTGDANAVQLAAALTQDLTALLARIAGFEVIARQSAATAANAHPDPQSIARALGARYLVTGSLRRLESGRLRLNVELVDGDSGRHLWSAREEIPVEPAAEASDALVVALTARLEPQLNLAELRAARAPEAGAGDDAWTMLRRAMGALHARGWSEAAVDEAVAFFRKSIAADPDLALAHAYKALVLALGGRMGLVTGGDLAGEARRAAEQAVGLAPGNSEVLGYAACALADLGEPQRAEPLLERAVEENPGNPQAWAALGACRLMLARVEGGIESLRRGLRASPADYRRSVWLTLLAGALMRMKQSGEAIETARAACRSDSNFYPARLVLATAFLRAGRQAEARRALEEARRIRPSMQQQEAQTWVGRRGSRELDAIWPR